MSSKNNALKNDKTVIKKVTEHIKTKEPIAKIKNVTQHIKTKEPIAKIKNVTEKIDTIQSKKITSGKDFSKAAKVREASKILSNKGGLDSLKATAKKAAEKGDTATINKIAKIWKKMKSTKSIASKVAKKGLKMLPLIGTAVGVGQALYSGDVSAALPSGMEMDAAGPAKGSLQHRLESGDKLTKEEVKRLMKKRMKK